MFKIQSLPALPLVLFLLMPAIGALANEGTIAFVGARIIDGTGAEALENAVLIIHNGRVRAVGSQQAVTIPADAQRIDVTGKTIMPGMINTHGHVGDVMGLEGGHYTRENLLRQLQLYARYGVTTVNSLGGDEAEGFALRDTQNDITLDRARIFVAGAVIGGNSVEEVRSAVNRTADLGANYIKTRVDDNLGSTAKPSSEIFSAIIDQAHSRRLPVAVHLYYLEDAKAVLHAGADLIAHSIRDLPVDQDLIALIKARNVCYIPTLTREISTFIYESEPDFFSDPFFLKAADPAVLEQLRSSERQTRMRDSNSAQQYKVALQVAMENIAILNDAGVAVVMGTDSGPAARFQGYFEHMELWLMVQAGMSPAQAVHAATGKAAECMNMSDLGTLQPGNWGDFIVLGANPLDNIENTRSIESVWIAGNRVATP